jgi:hypothetical protein
VDAILIYSLDEIGKADDRAEQGQVRFRAVITPRVVARTSYARLSRSYFRSRVYNCVRDSPKR